MKNKEILSKTVTQSACIFRIITTVESLFTRNDENGLGEYNSKKTYCRHEEQMETQKKKLEGGKESANVYSYKET